MDEKDMIACINKYKKNKNFPFDEWVDKRKVLDKRVIFQIPVYLFNETGRDIDLNLVRALSDHLLENEDLIYCGTYKIICRKLNISYSTLRNKIEELQDLKIYDYLYFDKKFLLSFHPELIKTIMYGGNDE